MDVSRICLGCMGFGDAERGTHKWVLNEEDSQPIIKRALDLAIGALTVHLSQDEVAYLEEPYVPHRIVGHQ